jgi:hypothetical protein
MEKVIFDTNFVRNVDPKKFLGGRSELERFSEVAEIILPDIVIGEIKSQKRRILASKKQSFLDNPFHWIKNLNDDETKNFDIEAHITELEKNETIEYEVINLSDYSVLEQMKDLALRKKPPFEAGDNTDKGFKDACIYFATLEYLQEISDKVIFVCCKDGRLKEAFKQHPNIIIIETFDEFVQHSIISFYSDYFVGKLKLEVHADITKENIIDYWVNINDNRVLLIEVDGERYVVEVDSGEVVEFKMCDEYSGAIDDLINSYSTESTHAAIAQLSPYLHFLSDDEILKILAAFTQNNQIYGIVSDIDVKEFISALYENKKEILSSELKASVNEALGVA